MENQYLALILIILIVSAFLFINSNMRKKAKHNKNAKYKYGVWLAKWIVFGVLILALVLYNYFSSK
nr:hypothetical protein [Allomuricauda sp.]